MENSPEKNRKIIAMVSGGYYEELMGHLILPKGRDIDEEKAKWSRWYETVYCAGLHTRPPGVAPQVPYVSFWDWLINIGATEPDESQLVVWFDY
jgi:hypothetical protein